MRFYVCLGAGKRPYFFIPIPSFLFLALSLIGNESNGYERFVVLQYEFGEFIRV